MMDNELLLFDRINVIKDTINKYGEENFYLSFSGGKDSAIVHYLLDQALPNNNIPRVFINTGIEYQMIVDFVKGLASRDNRFVIINPSQPIKPTLEKYGYPFKSKQHSHNVMVYQHSGIGTSVKRYLGIIESNTKFRCPKSLEYQFTSDFTIKLSDNCCRKLKKEPIHKWEKASNRHIGITGMRNSEDAGEDWETIKSTRENNPKEWSEKLEQKYILLNEKETAEKCARLNYHNFLLFFCATLSHLLRVGDTWANFYEKKGIESLAEFLRDSQGLRLYILRDGTGWEAFGDPRFYCYFNIVIYGACAISGNNWGTYRPHQDGEENPTERPNAPKVYTVAQYCQLVSKLKKLEQEAKAKAREHYEAARSSGLVYFVGGLESPALKVWKMRE